MFEFSLSELAGIWLFFCWIW